MDPGSIPTDDPTATPSGTCIYIPDLSFELILKLDSLHVITFFLLHQLKRQMIYRYVLLFFVTLVYILPYYMASLLDRNMIERHSLRLAHLLVKQLPQQSKSRH